MSLLSYPVQRPGVSLLAASCMSVGRGGTQGGPSGPGDSASWKDGPAAYPLTVLLVTTFPALSLPFDRRRLSFSSRILILIIMHSGKSALHYKKREKKSVDMIEINTPLQISKKSIGNPSLNGHKMMSIHVC